MKRLKKQNKESKLIFWLVGLDISTKLSARQWLPFSINRGIGFGLFGDFGVLLAGVGILALLFVLPNLRRSERVLLIAGGMGNVIDRLILGGVTDWVWLKGVDLWFNISDIYLTIAIFLIIYRELKTYERNRVIVRGQ